MRSHILACRLLGTPIARQTFFLFILDSLTNLTDYAFHIYLGRVLLAGDFAVFQTVNSALLVVVTAFGVFQPVVVRFVAARTTDVQQAIFREYFGWSNAAGIVFAIGVLMVRHPIANWLNVPSLTIALSAGVVLFSFSRPVVWGMLQGQQRFMAFGTTRLVYAVGRFVVAVLFIRWGWPTPTYGEGAAMGAVAALPVGTALSLGVGVLFLGITLTPRTSFASPLPAGEGPGVREGLRLSGYAFVAYLAYTALLNNDLLWVNRAFSPDEAGAYAGAVLLRRILLLLPGAIVVVFYPRAVAAIAQKRLPDRLLAFSSGVVTVTILALTLVYFAFGDEIVRLAFGDNFRLAGPLLGWMGVAILGFSIAAIWMNLALATNPGPFVALLAVMVGLQWAGLGWANGGLPGVVQIFALTGWGLALGGAVIYFGWQRPRLILRFNEK